MKRSPELDDRLERAAARYSLSPESVAQLRALLIALATEPDPHTSIAEPTAAADAHVADALAGLELEAVRDAVRALDMGSGAGFPGLALAVALPHASFDLLESQRRKCAVIERLAAAGEVLNVSTICERLETWAADAGAGAYDLATARALAPLPVVLEYAAPLLGPRGALVVWRGARSADEEHRAASACAELGLEPAEIRRVVPFDGARHRHLHSFRKVAPTPARFPRRPGVPARRPLA